MLPSVNIFTLRIHKYPALLVCLALLSTPSARGDFLVAYIKDANIGGYVLIADGLGAGQTVTATGMVFDGLATTHADSSATPNFIGSTGNISYGLSDTWDILITGVDALDDLTPGSSSVSTGIEITRVGAVTSTLDIIVARQFQRTGTPTSMDFYGGGTAVGTITEADVVFQSQLQSSATTTPSTTDTLTIGSSDYITPLPDDYYFDATQAIGSTTNPYYWLTMSGSFTLDQNESTGALNMQSDINGFSSVPEPSSITLLGVGFAATAAGRRWWKRRSASRAKTNAV